MTDRYAIIGHPVSQSLSPLIHKQFARMTGNSLTYDRIDCVSAKLEKTVEGFFAEGGLGLNVTVPHKKKAFLLADRVGMRARKAGAVNILSVDKHGGIAGDNTDGTGLVRDLVRNLGIRLEGARLLLLGAGGAARGVIAPLAEQKIGSLTIANRTYASALKLVESFAGLVEIHACRLNKLTADFDLIIHATAAGLKNTTPIFDGSVVRNADCYDVMYGRRETPFMVWAQRQGAQSVTDGWGMLVEQAAESFHIWRGVWPETAMLIAARPSKRKRDSGS
ncbi:MAG: shikimate dehydrogenase [Gammaproteobacteria bacterium]|nr:shikimate dehydrogenase [Gammaproteobacteria bacterium]MDH3766940.1 shikimate dehydrogenase [Gammaproteobacteria bacterium]